MSTRLVHLVIDANDPPELARFWAAALGWEVEAEEPDEVVVCPSGYDYPDPAALPLVFVPVPGAKTVKNRVHLDVQAGGGRGEPQEVRWARVLEAVARLTALGATVVREVLQDGVPDHFVMTDVEGNEFCVV